MKSKGFVLPIIVMIVTAVLMGIGTVTNRKVDQKKSTVVNK